MQGDSFSRLCVQNSAMYFLLGINYHPLPIETAISLALNIYIFISDFL